MEGYSLNNASCSAAVKSFVAAWTVALQAQGYLSGVYGSAASTMSDVASLGVGLPDAGWIANWNGVESVFGDPYVSDSVWANHQRVHQYKGGHKETWAGATINIDSNVVDGPVVGGVGRAAATTAAGRTAGGLGRLRRLEGDGDLAAGGVRVDRGRDADADDAAAGAVRLRRPADRHRSGDRRAGDTVREAA